MLGTGAYHCHHLQECVRSGPKILQRSRYSHLPFHATAPQTVPWCCGDRKAFPALMLEAFRALGPSAPWLNPRVEAQLGGSLSPKWLVGVVASTWLGRRHPAAGLLRRWATRRALSSADTRNGFKVLVHAQGVGLVTRAYRTARTLCNTGEQTALGDIILDEQAAHAR
jgi:hypothetical protein